MYVNHKILHDVIIICPQHKTYFWNRSNNWTHHRVIDILIFHLFHFFYDNFFNINNRGERRVFLFFPKIVLYIYMVL
jgi:hypothetical protein